MKILDCDVSGKEIVAWIIALALAFNYKDVIVWVFNRTAGINYCGQEPVLEMCISNIDVFIISMFVLCFFLRVVLSWKKEEVD